MKNMIHWVWVAAFISVSIFGIVTFNLTLRQHYFDEALAAKEACFHKKYEVDVLRASPTSELSGDGCRAIGSKYHERF
ncbi:hypothetical protein HY633_05205 [Candidatus Uhrbacteria bacterium]|nr:hypothetical protein [Candidatus Uhrbacteria bacterium]